MITDMDIVLPVAIVAAAVLVAFAVGYLAGAHRRRPAEDDLGIVRAVTTRRGRARQTRPWIITEGARHGHQ